MVDVLQLPSTTRSYSGGNNDGSLVVDGNWDSSYNTTSGSIEADFTFAIPVQIVSINYRASVHGHEYGDDTGYITLRYGVRWYDGHNNNLFDVFPPYYGHWEQYHDAMDRSADSGQVTMTGLNLDNCSKLAIWATTSAYNNKNSSAYSDAHLYTLQAFAQPPYLTAQPQSVVAVVSNQVQFSATVAGGTPLYYQWFLNGRAIDNQIGSTLTLPTATAADEGDYSLVVSNAVGVAFTTNATLTVLEPPTIVVPPRGLTVSAGNDVRFAVRAQGHGSSLFYQWYFNGQPLSGQTASSLVVPTVLLADSGTYSVAVSNVVSTVMSAGATLTVKLPTLDISDLSSLTVIQGSTAQFIVTATNLAGPLVFTLGTNQVGAHTGSVTLVGHSDTTALLSYAPSATDVTPFILQVSVQGTNSQSATVFPTVYPMPQISGDEDYIVSTHAKPQEDSSDYIVRTDTISDEVEIFNGQSRLTRSVTIAAKTLVIEPGNANLVFDSYDGTADIKTMTIFAETVIVRGTLELSNTTVKVFARDIHFQGAGRFKNVASVTADQTTPAWLTPATLRMVLAYARNLYMYGYLSDVRDSLRYYQFALRNFSAAPSAALPMDPMFIEPDPIPVDAYTGNDLVEVSQALGEITTLLWSIDRNLDFFGNPAGWTPNLSFGYNLGVFSSEVEEAIRELYLAHCMLHTTASLDAKVRGLQNGRQAAQREIRQNNNDLQDVQTRLLDSKERAIKIADEIADLQARVAQRVQDLQQQAEDAQKAAKKKNAWKPIVSTIGTICQFVPVGQPVLGTIGTGLKMVASINSASNPSTIIANASDIIGQFSQANLDTSMTSISSFVDGTLAKLDPTQIKPGGLMDYAKQVVNTGKDLAKMAQTIQANIKQYEVSETESKAQIAKVKSDSPEVNITIVTSDGVNRGLLDELTLKLEERTAIATEISEATLKIATLTDAIKLGFCSWDSMNRDLSSANRLVDYRVSVYFTEMWNRALSRLTKYHYYLEKSYEYRFLEPYPGELNLTPLFERVVAIESADTNKDGTLKATDFDALKAIFTEQIANVVESIVDRYNQTAGGSHFTNTYLFSAADLTTINSGQVLTLNLVERGIIPRYREQLIINHIKFSAITTVGAKRPSDVVRIRIDHSGESKLSRGINTWLFRHSSTSSTSPFRREQPFVWEADCDTGTGDIFQREPSEEDASLLRFLLQLRGIPTDNVSIFAKPGLWTDFKVQRMDDDPYVQNNYQVTQLKIDVDYDFRDQSTTLAVLDIMPSSLDIYPFIGVSRVDLAGRQSAWGKAHRTYERQARVTLTAPLNWGSWEFVQWTDRYGNALAGKTNPVATITLSDNKAVVAQYFNTDSDSDGLPDQWEISHFGYLAQTSDGDADGDGLSNLMEYYIGTDPLRKDTDGDGMSDLDELRAGTNPLDPSSALRFTVFEQDKDTYKLGWPSVVGKTYQVQGSSSLTPGSWTNIGSLYIGTGQDAVRLDPIDRSYRYYRLQLNP